MSGVSTGQTPTQFVELIADDNRGSNAGQVQNFGPIQTMRQHQQIACKPRVSTVSQGRSGLGLEAQQRAVREFLDGGHWKLIGEFTEIESGKRSDRPKLAEALRTAKRHRATRVIAKLDRLARNVAFISEIMEGDVEFVAVDVPMANRLTVHILAAVAEHEREMISQRTKGNCERAFCEGEHGSFTGRNIGICVRCYNKTTMEMRATKPN